MKHFLRMATARIFEFMSAKESDFSNKGGDSGLFCFKGSAHT